MAYNITMDVRAQIETLEKEVLKKEEQQSPVTSREASHQERPDHMGSPQKEDTGNERNVKERPCLQQLKTAKNWQIDNIRLFLLKIVIIIYIKKSIMMIPCSKSLVHQKLFHHLLFL